MYQFPSPLCSREAPGEETPEKRKWKSLGQGSSRDVGAPLWKETLLATPTRSFHLGGGGKFVLFSGKRERQEWRQVRPKTHTKRKEQRLSRRRHGASIRECYAPTMPDTERFPETVILSTAILVPQRFSDSWDRDFWLLRQIFETDFRDRFFRLIF